MSVPAEPVADLAMEQPDAKKRGRDHDAIDDVISQTLKQHEEAKKAKKAGKPVVVDKGKTLQEIEDEEGGPVKESLISVAQAKRAADRKKAAAEDDTDIPADVDRFEQELEVAEEGGVKFTAFSLAEERETGHFDAEGNFVEDRVAHADRDAWLESAEVVDDKLKQVIEQRKKSEAEAEAASRSAPLTDRQIAQLKADICKHMQPGESVTRALKRIRGSSSVGPAQKVLGKREKLRQALAGEQRGGELGDLELFNSLTEIMDQLFAEGETDVYTATKEELERSVAMWLPKQPAAAAAPATAAADEDGDEDMFGEEDDDSKAARPAAAAAATAVASSGPAKAADAQPQEAAATPAAQAPGPSGPASGAAPPARKDETPRTDFEPWPIKELKRFLQENGADPSGIVDKCDLVSRAKEVEEQLLASAASAAAAASEASVPDGYVLDPQSGYYHNAGAGMYYDAASSAYYNGSSWLQFDSSTGQYVPLGAPA